MITAFLEARYVVTTRPAAVEPEWLAAQDFAELTLQSMTSRDVQI
ncbi:hypothetical protein [Amycolatopsis sp. VC5-11]